MGRIITTALLLLLGLLVFVQSVLAAEQSSGPDLHGIVSAVDAGKKAITLTRTVREGQEQDFTFPLAEDVQILLPDTPQTGRLSDLARGTPVALQLAEDRKTVVGIRVETEPLQVTIRPLKGEAGLNDPFDVRLRVANTSGTTQSFRVMNCSWDEHWRSSNPKVSWVGWGCDKNFAETVTLAPGQAYEKTLAMRVLAGAPGDKVSYRMGFTPIDSRRTLWSNEATVQVTKK